MTTHDTNKAGRPLAGAAPKNDDTEHDLTQAEDSPGPLFDHRAPAPGAPKTRTPPDWLAMSTEDLRALGTQCARLMILLNAGAVTDALATDNGVGRPAQRVADLRRDGVPITTDSARRGHATIAVYRLERAS